MIVSTISISFSEAILPEAESLPVIESFDGSTDKFVPGQVIVGLKQLDTSFEAKANTIGGKVIDENNVLRALLIQVPKNAEDAFIKSIVKNPNVKFAEKNYITKALSIDPYWSYQWNMRIIQADDAWGIPPINQNIVVAVIDTGVQWNHPDLAANIWINVDDACGDGIDNDGNGYADDCRGWDFIGNENNPMDENGHGTHVAGTIGAITDNGVGVAGLAQQTIMPIRVLGPDGGPDWVVADGITYAAENGADVINLSLGCYCQSLTLTESAINHAYLDHNVLVVAASGNDNTNFPHIPSAFENAMAVAATDKNDKKASYSNFGDTIEIAAPGGDSRGGQYTKTYVLSTYLTNNYAFAIGTSMATPHVSGVAALILSQDSSLTHIQVREILKNTSDDLGDPGWDQYFGEGRVNAYAAVNYVSSSLSQHNPPVANDDDSVTTDEDTAIVIDVLSNDSNGDGTIDPTSVIVTSGPTNGQTSVNGVGNITYTPDTDYDDVDSFTYTVKDNQGAESNEALVTISVTPINDAPVANDDVATTTVNNAVTIDVLSNDYDVDGDSLSYSNIFPITTTKGGTVTFNADKTLKYSPPTDFASDDTFMYAITDGSESDSALVTITVNVDNPSAGLSVIGIDPNAITRGTTTPVTISGLGFEGGATVTITGGSGPSPTVTILTLDANTITANVFAKNGGPPRPSSWDVTVTNLNGDSATLSGELTIFPSSGSSGSNRN